MLQRADQISRRPLREDRAFEKTATDATLHFLSRASREKIVSEVLSGSDRSRVLSTYTFRCGTMNHVITYIANSGMSTGPFSVNRPDPTRQISDPTQPYQFMKTPEVEISKQSKEDNRHRPYGKTKHCDITRVSSQGQVSIIIGGLIFQQTKIIFLEFSTRPYSTRGFDPTRGST